MGKRKPPGAGHGRPLLLGAALVVLASQIYISLFTSDFKISVAILLLPTFAFLAPGFPVLLCAVIAAPGVMLLRSAADWVTSGSPAGVWPAHAPEMLFYLTYGLLLWLYLKRAPLYPFGVKKCLPLAAIDAAANFLELLVRMGPGVFSPRILPQLLAVAVGRTLLAAALLKALDYYGFQVLRREDAERYQRLLLMTAALKSEVAWMDKGTALIENTMNAAYRLYRQLRGAHADPQAADTALTIAKDIHEVKKEYFQIMRGISEALETDAVQPAMGLDELFPILGRSVGRTAKEAGKEIQFSSSYADPLVTNQHHYLMSIFRNLLNNAVEAAGSGALLHVSLTERGEGADYVFTVADDCGGIKPDRMDQIFTPGFSSKINYATGEINRGLGLTIVKDLVEEKLGGAITVQSAGGGTAFTIRIPKERLEGDHAVLSD